METEAGMLGMGVGVGPMARYLISEIIEKKT